MAKVIGGILGGIIGFMIGGPAGVLIGASIGTAAVSLISTKKPHTDSFQSSTYTTGKLVTQTSSSLCIPVVYGQVRMAGNIIWQNDTTPIKRIVSFCVGQISTISQIKLNDVDIAQISGASYNVYTGDGVQSIDSRVPGATQALKAEVVGGLRHEAYLAITCNSTEQISENYNLVALVTGKLVRVYTDLDTYTTQYTNNPIWCLMDFMVGYCTAGLDYTDLDIQSFIDNAEYCDKLVIPSGNAQVFSNLSGTNNDLYFESLVDTFDDNEITITYLDPGENNSVLSLELDCNDITISLQTDSEGNIVSTASDICNLINNDEFCSKIVTVSNHSGNDGSGIVTAMDQIKLTGTFGTEKRFTLNLAIDSRKSDLEWIYEILSVCQGCLVPDDDLWSVKIIKKEDPVQYLNSDDINEFSANWLSIDQIFDVVNINYKDPDYEWTYVQARAEADTYLREDRPFIKTQDINGVTNFGLASRLSFYYLNESQLCQMFCDITVSKKALTRKIGDVIGITDYVVGFNNKNYRILNISNIEKDQIKLTVREHNNNLFTDAKGSVAPTINTFTGSSSKIMSENLASFLLAEDGTYLLFE